MKANLPLPALKLWQSSRATLAGVFLSVIGCGQLLAATAVAPKFTKNPASLVAAAGATVSFSVTVTGTPSPTLEWQKDGVTISGATLKTLTLSSIQAADAGTYRAFATNTARTVSSSAATLSLAAAPAIVTPPVSQSVSSGQAVSLSFSFTGNPVPTFRWLKNGTLIASDTAGLSTKAPVTSTSTVTSGDGTKKVTITLGKTVPADAATYTAIATNATGSASATAILTVNIPPTITVQPVSRTVTSGQTVSFSVAASGTPPPTFQWLKNGDPVSGATSSTLSLPNVQPADAGSYSAVITGSTGGTITSSVAKLTVNVAPAITTQPVDLTANAGQTGSLSVVATGTPTPTFQWKKNGASVAGATKTTLTLSNLQPTNAGTYSVVVTNAAGSVSSSAVLVTVNTLPKFTTQPAGRTVIADQTASLSVVVTGTPAPTILWLRNGSTVSGATGTTLTFASVQPADAGSYVAVATNSVGTASSSAAVLVVNVTPAITTQPVGGTFNTGQTVTLTVAATGTPTPTLQWKKNGSNIANAKAATLTLSNIQAANAATYSVVATNAAGVATSADAVVLVNTPPKFTTQPVSRKVFTEQAVSLSAVVTGTPTPTLQWFKSGSEVSGATASTLSFASVLITDSGSYTLVATNSLGTVSSSAVTLSVSLPSVPVVTTSIASAINANSISVRGNVGADGGATVTERGILIGVIPGLTLSNSARIRIGSGTGSFAGTSTASSLSLSSGTAIFYRAYAINSAGAGLGKEAGATTSQTSVSTSSALDHWTKIKANSTTGEEFTDIASNGALYVAVGRLNNPLADGVNNRLIATSPDGVTWTARVSTPVPAAGAGDKDSFLGVTWNGTQFLAVGGGGIIMTSPDGVTWTSQTSETTSDLEDVVWNEKQYVAVGHNLSTVLNTTGQTLSATIITSPDGITWSTRIQTQNPNMLTAVVWNGTQFVAVGGKAVLTESGELNRFSSTGTILTSTNGTTWTQRAGSSGLSGFPRQVAWNGTVFVVVGETMGNAQQAGKGFVIISNNGTTWTSQTVPSSSNGAGGVINPPLFDVMSIGGLFVAVGDHEKIVTSRDGTNWTTIRNLNTSDSADELRALASNGRSLLVAGGSGSVFATDFISVVSSPAPIRVPAGIAPPGSSAALTVSAPPSATLLVTDETNGETVLSSTKISGLNSTPGIGSTSPADEVLVTVSTLTVGTPAGLAAPVNPVTILLLDGRSLRDASWNGNLYVAVGDGGALVTSTDGLGWTSRSSGTAANLLAVIWDGTQWLAIGSLPPSAPGTEPDTVLLTSPDGITWATGTK